MEVHAPKGLALRLHIIIVIVSTNILFIFLLLLLLLLHYPTEVIRRPDVIAGFLYFKYREIPTHVQCTLTDH